MKISEVVLELAGILARQGDREVSGLTVDGTEADIIQIVHEDGRAQIHLDLDLSYD